MKKSTITTAIAAALVTLAFLTPPGSAAPLDPKRVPADAKWVIHLDYEALTDTQLMEIYRSKRPQRVERARKWLQERYGIDPQQDLKDATLFSDSYRSHSGAIVLRAAYDREKVEADVLKRRGVKTTQWQDYTLYTWNVHKHGKKGKRRAAEDASNGDGHEAEDHHHHHHADDRSHEKSVTAVLVDDETVVFAPSQERAKAVVELLKGDADSLDGDSRLVSDVPEGTILYGAAIELENISRHERPFPVLKQHEHIRLVVGEREGELFKEVTLEARDEETAGQMKETLEGLVALSKLWSAEMKNLNALYDDVEIEQEGATVHAKWRGATAETVKGVEQLADHVKHWRKSKRAGR